MFRLIVTVCLVVMCATSAVDGSKMEKLAQMTIFQNCFGEEYMNEEHRIMEGSSLKCLASPQLLATDDLDFQDVIDDIQDMALPWGSRPNSSAQTFQLMSVGGRIKRHASDEKQTYTTAEKLYYLKEKMAYMIGNMTCMLLDLDLMKEDRTPNFDHYQIKIVNWSGSDEIKEELQWGLDVCRDFSMCITPQRYKSPFMKELGHFISFAKCMEEKKLLACMTTHYKKHAAKMEHDNINEILYMGLGMDINHQKKTKIGGLDALTATMSGDLVF